MDRVRWASDMARQSEMTSDMDDSVRWASDMDDSVRWASDMDDRSSDGHQKWMDTVIINMDGHSQMGIRFR